MPPGTKRTKAAAGSPRGGKAQDAGAKKKAKAAEVASGPPQQLLSRWFGAQSAESPATPAAASPAQAAEALSQEASSPTSRGQTSSASPAASSSAPIATPEAPLAPSRHLQAQEKPAIAGPAEVLHLPSACEVQPQSKLPKIAVDRLRHSSKFESAESSDWQQYNDIYKLRLDQLRGAVEREARSRWGSTIRAEGFLPSLVEHSRFGSSSSSSSDVVMIGIIGKDMKLRPNVLKHYASGKNLMDAEGEQGKSFCSGGDSMWLEDLTARVHLELHEALVDGLATGLVVAVRGRSTSSGRFCVNDLCLAWVPEPGQQLLPRLSAVADTPAASSCGRGRSYLALLSGLAFGSASESLSAARRRAIDFLARHSRAENGRCLHPVIEHVVVCGGLLAADVLSAGTKGALEEADVSLAQLASACTMDVMPGKADPSNLSLPQQPLHPQLFQRLRKYQGTTFVSNPAEFCLDGMQFLGHSGQPVDDFLRCLRLPSCSNSGEAALEALTTCLSGLHLAPTAPDTLETQPFCKTDPFVIDKVPHVLFSGNHVEARHCWHSASGRGSSGTQCICVPAFHLQQAVVLVNLTDPRDVIVLQDFGEATEMGGTRAAVPVAGG